MEIAETSSKNSEKIGKVLEKFLEPTFKIRNDVYVNLFLTHLVGKNGDHKIWQNNKQLEEQFCQWIIKASSLWEKNKVIPKATILSFALNLASQLSANEQIFVKLNCQNVYEGLVGVAEKNATKDPTVTLGLVTLMCSFLEHKSGLQWVMATTHWTDMINLGLKAHTMYIRKKGYQFVVKLLTKTIGFNRAFAANLVEILLRPLKDVLRSLPNNSNAQQTQIQSKELFESLKPSMDLLLETIQPLLKSLNKKVLEMFLEQEAPDIINTFILLSRNEDFSFELLRIQFLFLFFHVVLKVEGLKVVNSDSLSLFDCKHMFDLIKNEMDKNNVRCVIRICDYAHEIFTYLEPCMPRVVKVDTEIEFQMQVAFLQIAPIFGFCRQLVSDEKKVLLHNDINRKDFFYKWLKISAVRPIEICRKWLEGLRTKADLVDDVTFCLQYISRMKRLLNKQRAATIFPALVYSLTDALSSLKENPQNELSPSILLYFGTLAETIVDIVESFDLTWKDSIETLRVLDLAYDFLLCLHSTDSRLTVKGLKLLNTAISKYMSPDMVLLIYHTDNSKVSQTGGLLYAKCHDSSWEIRDSALEVVYTLSLNANTKFPAYTNLLLKAKLPQLVLIMAFKDGEYYVRTTAFKCLQELIQIPEVWGALLNVDKFLDNLLDVFENETEGIVRKEAAAVIYKIDKFQRFPEDILPRVYDVMTHAVTGDLYWEVKYSALDFWFNLWEQHLNNQGMIDYTFPSHTFSKEHKKIVALNEAEVRKRIVKVLNQLSLIGCLHVMKSAVQDDCDMEVSKKATSFTFNTLKMFKMYKVYYQNADLSESPVLPTSRTHEFNKPISPANSHSALDPSPASIENSEIQFSNSPFFDPVSPFSAPHSPSVELNLLTPISIASQATTSTNQYSPQQNQSPAQYEHSANQQAVPVQNSVGSLTQPERPFSTSSIDQISPSLHLPNGVDAFSYEDISFDAIQLENMVSSNGVNSLPTDQMLDDFLNSNDMTLLQQIYHPSDQVTNNTTQMKTKTYLAPSQYLRFVYKEVECYAVKKTQWLNSLDEFDSLLDDILKEYNIVADVNSMDCY